MTSRGMALQQAITDLDWLTHSLPSGQDRYRTAVEILTDTGTLRTIAIGSGGSGGMGVRGKGDHSDPTAAAVVGSTSRKVSAESRKTLAEMARLVNTIAETAEHLRAQTTRALYDALLDRGSLGHLREAKADAQWCNTIPHTVDHAHHALRRLGRDEDANELHHACGHLERSTRCLYAIVSTTLGRAVQQATEPKPEQPKLSACRNHQAHGYTVLAPKGLCPDCEAFRKRYKCLPSAAILKAWDYGRGWITPAMIAEAQAKRGKRAS